MQLPSAAILLAVCLSPLVRPPTPTSAQTAIGCDGTCPPLGYESDSSHICPGDVVDAATATRVHDVCHPLPYSGKKEVLSFEKFRGSGRVTVVANYYTGCEAGRRESGVYAGVAQRTHDETGGLVTFVSSLKGGGDCPRWAGQYQEDALKLGLNGGVRPSTMPLTVNDDSLDVRDRFFTPPYPHPSYIVLDENLEVTFKGVGPCCGYASYYECTDDVALELDKMLTDQIYEVYNRQQASVIDGTAAGTEGGTTATGSTDAAPTNPFDGAGDPATADDAADAVCRSTTFSEWSACSMTCGDGGIQFRHRADPEEAVQTRPCPANAASDLPACGGQCVAELGAGFGAVVVADGLDSPRDLAFHPTPGVHLGARAEGRSFRPDAGEELWVANGNNHSISIVASLGTEHQTTMSRRDRGYYHYMINVTALAFNAVGDSPRNADQDTFNYFALCNDNANDYTNAKEANYFMGPTLYDTDTVNKKGRKNTVTGAGEDCSGDPADQCFFLHADMLHEAPVCVGIAHDPEVETAYGTVYWAFDATGDNAGDGGQLVRFDFSQPHGPGSMDHSIASVRRYPEVRLHRDPAHAHGHAGMVVHPDRRVLYVANPGMGTIVAVNVDTGRYSRTAREEYPIFSNRLPSFEYSVYECVEREDAFASGLDSPTGLALSRDGTRLFVAERGGRIVALDAGDGAVLQSIDLSVLGYSSIGGLAISPRTGYLYFVDMDTNRVVRIDPSQVDRELCAYQSRTNASFQSAFEVAKALVDGECGEGSFSLARDYSCEVDGTIPNGTLFEQVHVNTGYASDDPNVQAMAGMDEAAALLANRTDCGYDSELNLDALLLGGFYCHVCLPRDGGASCDPGGACANVQWQGFTCDNEYRVDLDDADDASLAISNAHRGEKYPADGAPELRRGVTYRFVVRTGAGRPVSVGASPDGPSGASPAGSSAEDGPILLAVDDATPDCLYMTSEGTRPVVLMIGGAKECPDTSAIAPGEEVNIIAPGNDGTIATGGNSDSAPKEGIINTASGENGTSAGNDGTIATGGNSDSAPGEVPEAESSTKCLSSIGVYFALVFVTFALALI